MRWSEYSSDFIRIARAKGSVKTRAWDCRFRARLSRLTADGFGRATGWRNRSVRVAAHAMIRTSRRGTARARVLWSNCRRMRHDRRCRAGTGLHATAVVHGESGVLILGPSGSGKSALALALMARASSAGAFGALIGDDRIFVRKAGGQLVASGAANMAGIIERRMAGLIAVPHEPATIVRLAVELCEQGRHGRDCRTIPTA